MHGNTLAARRPRMTDLIRSLQAEPDPDRREPALLPHQVALVTGLAKQQAYALVRRRTDAQGESKAKAGRLILASPTPACKPTRCAGMR